MTTSKDGLEEDRLPFLFINSTCSSCLVSIAAVFVCAPGAAFKFLEALSGASWRISFVGGAHTNQ